MEIKSASCVHRGSREEMKERGGGMKGCNRVTEQIYNVAKGNVSEDLTLCFLMLPISTFFFLSLYPFFRPHSSSLKQHECAGGGTWSLPGLRFL